MRLVTRVIAVTLLGGPALAYGAEPSLKETLSWLKGNLAQMVVYDYEGVTYTRVLQVDFPNECTLSLTDSIHGGKSPRTSRFDAPLGALDPTHHESGDFHPGIWSLDVPATGGKSPIKFCSQSPCEREAFTSKLFFLFSDRSIAERASKALSHAIRLCGGKADVF